MTSLIDRIPPFFLATIVLLTGCGGGGGSSNNPTPPPPQFTVSVTVTGLQVGQQFTATLDGSVDVVVSDNGSASFTAQLDDGAAYDVTITAQPATQTCTVAAGSGTVQNADVDLAVTCVGFMVGGAASGLDAGDTLSLELNGGEQQLTITADGAFTFDNTLPDQATYSVVLQSTPVEKLCTLSGESGTVAGSDVTSIVISCVRTVSIGGTLSGLVSDPVVLQQDGGDDLQLDANGSFTFATRVETGNNYDVSIAVQPNDAVCAVTNGSGTTAATDITDVEVNCIADLALFAYAANDGDGTISRYKIDGSGTLTELDPLTTAGPVRDLTVGPNGRYLYTASFSSPNISTYAIDPVTGALTATGAEITPTSNPWIVRVHPTGRFAYGVFRGVGVVLYDIDPATGALSESATFVADFPQHVAFDPEGRFLFVIVETGLAVYSIDNDTGLLTDLGTDTVEESLTVAVDPTGRFVLVGQLGDLLLDDISSFRFDPTDGSRTLVNEILNQSSVFTGDIAIHPNGAFAYTANAGNIGDGDLTTFSIDPADGTIANVDPTLELGGWVRFVEIDPTGRFAYVVNGTDNNISPFSIDPTNAALTAIQTPVATGTRPSAFALAQPKRLAYVLNQNDATLSAFTVDPEGSQNPLGQPVTTPSAPRAAITEATGRFVYVLSDTASAGALSTYHVNQGTGLLTDPGLQIATAATASALAAHPTTRFVYVAQSDSSVATFSADQIDGSLTLADTLSVTNVPTALALHPTGQFLYATFATSNEIAAFSIDPVDGTPTQVGAALATGTEPVAVAISPSGAFAYVTNRSSNDVSLYSIDAITGALTAIPPSVAAGTNASDIAIAPDGRFAYILNDGSNDIITFGIDATTGLLSQVGSALPAGGTPSAISIDASSRFAYVTLSDTNTVQRFAIDPSTGAITPSGASTPTGVAPLDITLEAGTP